MAYPVSPGYPSASGVFIPEIWSGKLIEKYYDASILPQISNTDYEGEISAKGDKVIIRTRPTITIRDYVEGQALINETPEGDTLELLIDQGFYWSTKIGDITKKQQDVDQMNLWAEDAAEQMKIKLDTRVLGSVVPDFHASNVGATAGRISGDINLGVTGTPLGLTAANILATILNAGQVLDEQNVPETGRFIVLPFWATNLLKQSDLKLASLTGDSMTPLRNGKVGMVDRFTLYNSNLLPKYTDGSDTTYHFPFGTQDGLTFATQLTETENLRVESTFGDIMRGLLVFGFEVIKPEALGAIYATKG